MNNLKEDIIALNMLPGLGSKRITKILNEVENIEEIASSKNRFADIRGKVFFDFEKLKKIKKSEEFKREIDFINREGLEVLCINDKSYPQALLNIYDPPIVLFCRGKFLKSDGDAVAIIGSRKCSPYGIQMSEKLAFDLAGRGISIVSGMARGIDSAAHEGALKAGGRTIAVMGSGFRHLYPPENIKLFSRIAETGIVVTEYLSDIRPERFNFPRRNRIISGLSSGVVVVEAEKKSGAMITVNLALDQGREVFAVPGRADTSTSNGTNDLIKNGAKLVASADDILEELNLSEKIN